jgi:hypothetical protein
MPVLLRCRRGSFPLSSRSAGSTCRHEIQPRATGSEHFGCHSAGIRGLRFEGWRMRNTVALNIGSAALLVVAIVWGTPVSARSSGSPLGRFGGDWELRGRSVEGHVTHAYRISEYCRWSEQHTFMICEEREHGGPVEDVTFMWRDGHGVYRFAYVGTDGSKGGGTIRISPARWVWLSADGARRDETVNDWVTPDSIHYTSRASLDGGKTWKPTGDGTETRIRRGP